MTEFTLQVLIIPKAIDTNKRSCSQGFDVILVCVLAQDCCMISDIYKVLQSHFRL